MTRAAPKSDPAKVVVFGGGVAALEALLGLRELAEGRVAVQLVAPNQHFAYAPLSVAEPFGQPGPSRLLLGDLVRSAGGEFLHDSLAEVDDDSCVARTRSGLELGYDALVVATGARAEEAVPGALCFDGRLAVGPYRELLRGLEGGGVGSVAFALPEGTGWALPLYELALLTATWAWERGLRPDLTLVTPESQPLEGFGEEASRQVSALLAEKGVSVVAGARPQEVASEGLVLAGDGELVPAERVVAMPRLVGRVFAGLPHDAEGFLAVDEHGRVRGLDCVYAAGDIAAYPVKQGGLAAQQADIVAEAIAAWVGAPVRATGFRPLLRGVLLTGDAPRFLRSDSGPDHRRRSIARLEALWWPPVKVAGRRLGPFLAARGVGAPPAGVPELHG